VKADVDIDEAFMAQQNGTLTIPITVTGSWKLTARVWIATRLIYMAAKLLNYGVTVDGPAEKP